MRPILKDNAGFTILTFVAATLAMPSPALAEGYIAGKIAAIQSYKGHSGILVQLGSAPINPDGCPSSAWYIFPDDSQRAEFVQSGLLAALHSGKSVWITVRDCFQQYPMIVTVSFLP